MIHHLPLIQWALLAPSMLGYSYRHQWWYSEESARQWNAQSEMVGIFGDDEECVALAAVRTVALPLRVGGIAYVSGGPLVRQDSSRAELRFALGALIDQFVTSRKLVLRVAPPVEWVLAGFPVHEILTEAGFRLVSDPQPYRTLVLDLSQPLDVIQAGFHPKWRYSLRRALANNLVVRRDRDRRSFDVFAKLHHELMARKGFSVNLGTEFYRRVNSETPESERFNISLAYVGDEAVAGHFGSTLGDTCVYVLGASSPLGNSLNASYLLQWDAIVCAKAQGARWYDLGGVDPDENPGVHRFKERMNGHEVVVPGPYEIAPSGLHSVATRIGEFAYRALRGSRARPVKK